MAPITLAARAAYQLARRATDPLGVIWKDLYTDSVGSFTFNPPKPHNFTFLS